MDQASYLASLEQFGVKLGLDGIRLLCEALDHPESAQQSILVAGTNGKGSTAAMTDAIVRGAGLRTGRYTSPHLSRLVERFCVCGRPVSSDALDLELTAVRQAAERLQAEGRMAHPPTFFEVTTAAALCLFRRLRVDIAILEVGLGGRLDATNVVSPVAAAITTVDLDHEAHLGTTIGAIAAEKAGIIKPGMPVVLGETKPDAVETITRVCQERGARLIHASDGVDVACELGAGGTHLTLSTPRCSYPPVRLALRGRHQVANAIVAVRLVEVLETIGVTAPPSAVAEGLAQVQWPGRLELVDLPGNRQVLFDVAHNPAGAAALAAYLREASGPRIPIVISVLGDKDVEGIVRSLGPVTTQFICTRAPSPRALRADSLADCVRGVSRVPVAVEPHPRRALDLAWRDGRLACVTGSIFLVGHLREAIGHASDTQPA